MHIFFWFLIIALVALIINLFLLRQMKQKNKTRLAPVIGVVAGSYLLAGCLYLITTSHGTDVLTRTLAASFPIDPASFENADENQRTVYSFHCDNGIPFRFDDTALLPDSADVSGQAPDTVEVYSCQVRTGYDWCYLGYGTQVCYAFR